MKYWKTKLLFELPLLLYLLKSGIFDTRSPVPLPRFEKGLSKAPVGWLSRREVEVERARMGAIEEERGRARSNALEVEVRAAIVRSVELWRMDN